MLVVTVAVKTAFRVLSSMSTYSVVGVNNRVVTTQADGTRVRRVLITPLGQTGHGSAQASVHVPLASSPRLQLCGGKAWYRLHAHARAFCKICRIRIRTDIVGLYIYGQFYGKVYGNLAHAHAVDTRPSLRIIEGLGTRLMYHPSSTKCC